MAIKKIAGHEFEGAGSDRRCVALKSDGSICGIYYDHIKRNPRENVGMHGFAHVSDLTGSEATEIEEENARLAMYGMM